MSHRRNKDASGRQEVERAVLAYLHHHPDAADTLDGIVTWWLPQQRYETERERIERVLGGLVERGDLRCNRLPDGAVLYALNRSSKPPLH
ncbi:MAG TPA: hypothetical protein VFG49_13865 [Dyella sp.]|uniref:hypothetical protein n=1 Tax=Dyella sp. TaxID=1869338 RepID=UPI002D779028|nr:hypothetical protein [Dyella sp.]HET6554609.1 hypothetical protein [Dyella sp.]